MAPQRAKALADYVDYATKNDLFLTYVIINPQADRSKNWGEQDRNSSRASSMRIHRHHDPRRENARHFARSWPTRCWSPICSHCKQGEEDIAFSCALPMNARGMRVLSRKSYEASAVSVFDNPLSSRFDENDALIYFDDVKVPWERRVRVSRHRHVPCSNSTRPGPFVPELPGADPPVGEDRFSGRPGAPADRGDRHHQHCRRSAKSLAAWPRRRAWWKRCCRAWRRRAPRPASTACRTSTSCMRRRC